MRQIFLLSIVALLLGSLPAEAQREIRVASFTHPKSVTVASVLQPFVEAVNAEVGDTVRLRGYWGGSLGRDPKKYYDLVRDGVADIGYFDPGYSPGRFKDFGMFELPFTARNGTEASIAMWRMYKMGLIGGLDEIKVLGVFSTDLYQIHTSKPVESVFDLQGMKLRAAAPMHAEALRALNGVPVGLPITTTTEALSRGVVDGALTGYSTLVTFRMLPVVKHHYDIPLGVVPVAVGMNKRSWDSLPDKVKQAIDKHSGEVFSRKGGGGFDRAAEGALKQIMADKSRTRVGFKEADYEKGKAWAKPIYAKWISEVRDGQRKLDAYLKVLDEIRQGR